MTVGELERYMALAGVTLTEASYRVVLAESLETSLEELGRRMSAPEMNDWLLLLDVEAEGAQLEAENARRRGGK